MVEHLALRVAGGAMAGGNGYSWAALAEECLMQGLVDKSGFGLIKSTSIRTYASCVDVQYNFHGR